MDKKKLIIDTNFLLIPGQFRVDIFSEVERIMQEPFEFCVVEKSMEELNNLTIKGKEADRFSAKLGLVLAIQKNLKRLPCSKEDKTADDSIVSYANNDVVVATQDKALRDRVREKGGRIIGLRQKKYLVMM
jgi:rRNA-processing protein FCF1